MRYIEAFRGQTPTVISSWRPHRIENLESRDAGLPNRWTMLPFERDWHLPVEAEWVRVEKGIFKTFEIWVIFQKRRNTPQIVLPRPDHHRNHVVVTPSNRKLGIPRRGIT